MKKRRNLRSKAGTAQKATTRRPLCERTPRLNANSDDPRALKKGKSVDGRSTTNEKLLTPKSSPHDPLLRGVDDRHPQRGAASPPTFGQFLNENVDEIKNAIEVAARPKNPRDGWGYAASQREPISVFGAIIRKAYEAGARSAGPVTAPRLFADLNAARDQAVQKLQAALSTTGLILDRAKDKKTRSDARAIENWIVVVCRNLRLAFERSAAELAGARNAGPEKTGISLSIGFPAKGSRE